jgi:4-amino-4-deoxy-L-arabinose transferase-like glycosyltransferase
MSFKIKSFYVVAYVLHVAWIIVLASVPPVSRDALTHHLAVPKIWVEQGGLREIPEIAFSYYPQLIDLLYTVPIIFGHDIAAKYIHFTFALLTALIIFLFVRRLLGPAWGALSGLLFLTIPLIVKLSVTVYVDLGLVFFTAGALFASVIWLEDPAKLKWLLIAAICSGLALSTKYNAIVSFLVLSLLVPFFFLNGSENKEAEQLNAVRFGVLFVSISMLVFSPWLIRNYTLTGNPMYPLMQNLFSAEVQSDSQAPQTAEEHARLVIDELTQNQPKPLGPLLTRKLVHEEGLGYTMLIPLRIFYEGKDDDPKYFDGRLNPMLLVLPLVLLVMAKREGFRHRETAFFAVYAGLVILLTFMTKDMRVRWIATIVPPLVVLATYSLYVINGWLLRSSRSQAMANAVTGILVAVYLLPNLLYAHNLHQKIDPLPYIAGKQSYQDYVQTHRPEFAAVDHANRVVPAGSKVLGLYLGNRRYYFSVDAVVVNAVFTSIAEKSGSGKDIAEQLTRFDYSHLVIHNDLFQQWLQTADPATQSRVANFANYRLRQLVSEGGYGLYEIVDPSIPGPAD